MSADKSLDYQSVVHYRNAANQPHLIYDSLDIIEDMILLLMEQHIAGHANTHPSPSTGLLLSPLTQLLPPPAIQRTSNIFFPHSDVEKVRKLHGHSNVRICHNIMAPATGCTPKHNAEEKYKEHADDPTNTYLQSVDWNAQGSCMD